jgi:hypothetical protein
MISIKERLTQYMESTACDYSLKELETITINMAKVSELLNEDLTGDLSNCFKQVAYPPITKISDLESSVQAITSLISIKTVYSNINENDVNELKEIVNKHLADAFDYIESPLVIHNDKFKSMIGSYEVPIDDRTATFYLEKDGARVIVSSSILAGVSNNGYARLRIIEWKYNPYKFTPSGINVTSSLLSFTFIDQDNKEIPLPNDQVPIPAITLYIPLRDTNMSNELECVYYDIDEKDFLGIGCSTMGLEGDTVICETNHLTEFGVLNSPYEILMPPIKNIENSNIQSRVLY